MQVDPPHLTADCHVCGRVTSTRYIALSSGHVANACAVCGACRRGKPYVSKTVYAEALQLSRPGPVSTGERFNDVHPNHR